MNKVKRSIVIGISGGSGSGKTTFCKQLANNLEVFKVKTISTDDYFKEAKPKVSGPFNGKVYGDYDHPSSLDFEKLNGDFSNLLSSKKYDVFIVEGLMVLHFEELRRLLDLKIFVDCPSDERLVRRIKRDVKQESFEEISAEYLDLVRHRHNEFVEPTRWHADIVINGSSTSEKSVEMITKWVLAQN